MFIDLAIVSTCIAIVGALGTFLYKLYKVLKRYDGIPERVDAIEEQLESLEKLDMQSINSALADIGSKMDRDYANIQYLARTQSILVEGMMDLFQHLIDGNNVDTMKNTYRKMEKDIMKTAIDTERGE